MPGKSLHDFEPNSVAVAAQLPLSGALGSKKARHRETMAGLDD